MDLPFTVSAIKGYVVLGLLSEFMHLCEDELTSTSQTSLTHTDECLGTKIQLYLNYYPVFCQTSGSFMLSSHVIHTSSGESIPAFRTVVHIMCAGLMLPAPCRQLGLSYWSSCSCCNTFLQHAKLPLGLTFTNQTPSDLILLPFRHFLFKSLTLPVSLQPC